MTVNWESEFDWDNAVSENNVFHPSDILYMDIVDETFDSYTVGNQPPSPWNNLDGGHNVDDTRSRSGNNSLHCNGNSIDSDIVTIEAFQPLQYDQFAWSYYETSSNQELTVFLFDSNDDLILYCGVDNPQIFATDNGGHNEYYDPTDEYERWRRFTITFNWDAGTYDILWEDITGFEEDQLETFGMGATQDLASIALGVYDSNEDMDIWIDDITVLTASSGSLITAGKVT